MGNKPFRLLLINMSLHPLSFHLPQTDVHRLFGFPKLEQLKVRFDVVIFQASTPLIILAVARMEKQLAAPQSRHRRMYLLLSFLYTLNALPNVSQIL